MRIPFACRMLLYVVFGMAIPCRSPAYIAVKADRLTLCEVMLEFPTVAVLRLTKFDAKRGAYVFEVGELLQGETPASPVRFDLSEDGTLPKRLAGVAKGARVVAFIGSPDNRSLICAEGGWFLTRPDQGWQRFAGFRDDFRALSVGTPDELALAVQMLTRGVAATLATRIQAIRAAATVKDEALGEVLRRIVEAGDRHLKGPAIKALESLGK